MQQKQNEIFRSHYQEFNKLVLDYWFFTRYVPVKKAMKWRSGTEEERGLYDIGRIDVKICCGCDLPEPLLKPGFPRSCSISLSCFIHALLTYFMSHKIISSGCYKICALPMSNISIIFLCTLHTWDNITRDLLMSSQSASVSGSLNQIVCFVSYCWIKYVFHMVLW